jgi:Uma2 family endonuclease
VAVMGSMECKLLIPALASERHPDVAIYLGPPPKIEGKDFWSKWIPEIVVEIVSPSSQKRDYEEKPQEYLRMGVREYWIVDARKRALVVMRRVRNRWVESVIEPPALYRTRLIPGLEISCGAVFEAAGLE